MRNVALEPEENTPTWRPPVQEEAARIAEAMGIPLDEALGYARGIRGEETDEDALIVVAPEEE